MSKSQTFRKLAANIKLAIFDFDGVFTDNTVYVNQKGEEMVRCWRGDGLGLVKLRQSGVKTWVISTEKNPIVSKRCQKLKIPYRQGLDKKEKGLLEIAKKLKAQMDNIAYVGNDINDLECMKIVGFPIAVNDAYPEVKKLAKYVTSRPGGFGAVREICDRIVAIKN